MPRRARCSAIMSRESEPEVNRHCRSPIASTTATVDGTMAATTPAGASSSARARQRYGPEDRPSLTNLAASSGLAGPSAAAATGAAARRYRSPAHHALPLRTGPVLDACLGWDVGEKA